MTDPLFASATRTTRALRVALPVPIDSLFDYLPPADDPRPIEAWLRCRVVVPFSGRQLTGVVVDIAAEDAHPGELATALQGLDDEPVIGASLLDAIREGAERALCPLGLAVGPALPPGSAPRMVRQLHLTARGRDALESGAARGMLRALLEQLATSPLSSVALARRVPRSADALRDLERDGLASVRVLSQGPAARLPTERVAIYALDEDVEDVCDEHLSRAPRQAEMLRRIAGGSAIATSVLGGGAALRALADRSSASASAYSTSSTSILTTTRQLMQPPKLSLSHRAKSTASVVATVLYPGLWPEKAESILGLSR